MNIWAQLINIRSGNSMLGNFLNFERDTFVHLYRSKKLFLPDKGTTQKELIGAYINQAQMTGISSTVHSKMECWALFLRFRWPPSWI
jgi:hypothetical protein